MSLRLNNSIDRKNDINSLIDFKKKVNKNEVDLINKMIIILLVTKLETRIEDYSSEWFKKLKSKQSSTVSVFTEEAINEIIKETFEDLEEDFQKKKMNENNKSKYNNFNIKFNKNIPLSDIDVDFRITLGSHKEKEVVNLFKKLGVSNVFEEMNAIRQNKDEIKFKEVNVSIVDDLEGTYNKLVQTRNSLIHNDNSIPFSDTDIDKYIELVNLFDEFMTNYK